MIDQGYRETISGLCFGRFRQTALTLVLYDVTTLYFEVEKEDDYRKPGLSKERRLEPQITIGLLVDSTGFPLEIQSFEGNCAEVKTVIPVLEGFKARHGLTEITVTADAATLSAGNIEVLERLGYHYIIGSRLTKTPYAIEAQLTIGSTWMTGRSSNLSRLFQSAASRRCAARYSSTGRNGLRLTSRTSIKRLRKRRRWWTENRHQAEPILEDHRRQKGNQP